MPKTNVYVCEAILRDGLILDALQCIDANMTKLADKGGEVFDNINAGAKSMGLNLGIVAGRCFRQCSNWLLRALQYLGSTFFKG